MWIPELFPRYFALVRDSHSIKRIGNQKLAGIYSRKKITNANGNRVIDGGYEHLFNFRDCPAVYIVWLKRQSQISSTSMYS